MNSIANVKPVVKQETRKPILLGVGIGAWLLDRDWET